MLTIQSQEITMPQDNQLVEKYIIARHYLFSGETSFLHHIDAELKNFLCFKKSNAEIALYSKEELNMVQSMTQKGDIIVHVHVKPDVSIITLDEYYKIMENNKDIWCSNSVTKPNY
jgi:hypothetical protein